MTKRLQELQLNSATPLLEEKARRATLTLKGREVLLECERLLDNVGHLESVRQGEDQVARVLRIGVTDLVVMTWFATFVSRMREVHPRLTILPTIDLSVRLREKVLDGRLDLAILPEPELPGSIARIELGRAQFAWFCPAGSFDAQHAITLRELTAWPVIEQTRTSIVTTVISRMFDAAGVDPQRVDGGNNVMALSALVEARVGVSCLPVALLGRQLEQGRLQRLITDPPAPTVAYCATFQKHPFSALMHAAADVAGQCCDFGMTTNGPAGLP